MKVVILCGGLGTRLREETEFRPKPMVEVGGRPILWHIMKTYAHYGHNDFVLCLGYRGQVIKQYFLDYQFMNNDFSIRLGDTRHAVALGDHEEQHFNVTLAETGLPTMTGGRVRRVRKYIDDDLFMVTYGDGVADVDINKVLAFHKSHGKVATITTVRPTSRFGVLNVSDGGAVTRFIEKPRLDGWISAGYFVFHRRLFDYIAGDETVLEREPLERLAAEGQVMAYRHEGFFFAMDTYREYLEINELWDKGKAPWKVWAR